MPDLITPVINNIRHLDSAIFISWFPISFLNLFCDLERPVDRGGKVIAAENDYGHRVTPRLSRRGCCAGVCSPFTCKSRVEHADAGLVVNSLPADLEMCAKISTRRFRCRDLFADTLVPYKLCLVSLSGQERRRRHPYCSSCCR